MVIENSLLCCLHAEIIQNYFFRSRQKCSCVVTDQGCFLIIKCLDSFIFGLKNILDTYIHFTFLLILVLLVVVKVVSNSLQPHGLYSPWNSPGQNTGVGSLALLQGISPTQANSTLTYHHSAVAVLI